MFDFPAGAAPGAIFEPNGPGTDPSYTFTGVGWTYGSTTELLISSLVPNAAICGSAVQTVRALGANFTNTCQLHWDGVARATTFVSVSELTCQVDPTTELTPRTAVVTVQDGATIGVGAVPFNFRVVTTVEYRIGIDETSPGIVDVLPANTIGEIGGVTVTPRDATTQGLLLDLATGALSAPLATPLLAGTLTEPPADSKGYVRQTTGASSTWVPPADTPTPDYGIGLTEDTTTTPTVVNLDIANTNGEIGGVMTEARTDVQGLNMDVTGLITVPLATPTLAGSITEPPADSKGYVRQTTGASSTWVPPADTPLPDAGIGLTLDATTPPGVIDLDIANTNGEIGGVMTVPRTDVQGLDMAADGTITVPLATPLLAGAIVEPVADAKGYVRTTQLNGVSQWVPPATPDAPPLAITLINPNTAQVGSALQVVEVHGTSFTAATTVNFGTATPPVTFISPTELTFEIDPALETVRTVSVTINDSGLPGQGDASFYFRAADKLYQGTWQPVTNTPDILIPPKGDKWMWIADTVDPRVEDLVPMTIPGIAGMKIREGDHVVWDAAAAAFTLVASARALAVTDIVPSQALIGSPVIQVNVYGTGFTATTEVLWEGVPIATQFLDENKLRISVDPTAVQPARGFVVVGVQDGAIAGNGAAGFQFIDQVTVQPAGDTKPEIGVVFVPARTNMQALTLNVDGQLTCYLATPGLAGAILEPPADDKGYVRQTRTAGGSSWVPPALTPLPDWGIGLTGDMTTPPGIVNLDIANTNGEIGGVMTIGRGPTQGLDLDAATGLLTAPLATDVAAGSIVEPPADGAVYSRMRTAAGVSSWVPGASGVFIGDDPPAAPTVGMLWFESDTGHMHVYYQDVDSSQWVQF